MADTDSIYVYHILQAVERIESYTAGLSYERFREDVLKQDGIVRQLEIIGEAAKHISQDFKDKVDLPWKDITGMRDMVVHEYFDIDLQTVWDSVVHDVPSLKEKLV